MQNSKVEGFTERALRAARLKFKREITLTELGKLAGGIKQPSVSEWAQTATGGPKLENCIALANNLGVCVEWLYTGREPMFAGSSEDKTLAKLIGHWPYLDDLTKGELLGIAMENARGKEPKTRRAIGRGGAR